MELGQEQGADFEAEVQIGKGMRFIDRKGSATIEGGKLTLRKRDGDLIVEAPIAEVRADSARFSGGGATRIWIGGDKYTIEPLRVRRTAPESAAGAGVNLGGDVKRLKQGRELTKAFLTVLEAEGAAIGKG